MQHGGTKRERLLDWIKNGDPKDVPVFFMPGLAVVALCLGKDLQDVTWLDAIRFAEETGTHSAACIQQPMPFDAVPFLDDIKMTKEWDKLPDGTPRSTQQIKTPEGNIKAVIEFSKELGQYHREFFVKGEEDLPAFACFIRKTTEAVVKNPAVRQTVDDKIRTRKEEIRGVFPTQVHVFCAAVELMSSYYMDQTTAIFAVSDNREMMEELMDYHWQMTQVWLELVAKNDVDIYSYAINGFEWLSPDLYERYMIPQARRINEFAAAHGGLSWLHTCGKLKNIARMKTYQRMKVDVLESLSSPPTGDIDDLPRTRRDIGSDITTRGGINEEFFYSDIESLRKQANYVLDSTAGYRHMLGDTDEICPSALKENFQAVIDLVRERGQLFE